MQTLFGMILGALLLAAGVYIHDSMTTSSVATGETAASNRTIVNWDVASADWQRVKEQTHKDWVRLTEK